MRIRFTAPRPGWEVRRHPDSPYVVGADAGGVPPGHGVLRIRLGHHREWVATPGLPGPATPVVLVDGHPACDGWGVASIVLPAGDRLVEVQSSGSAARQVVGVPDGGETHLDFATTLNSRGGPERDLAARGRVRLGRLATRRTALTCLAVFLLALIAPVALGAELSEAGVVLWATAMFGAPTAVALLSRWRHRRLRREAGRPAPLPGADGAMLLDSRGAALPDPPDGYGALVLDTDFRLAGPAYGNLVARHAPPGQRLPRLRRSDYVQVSLLGEMDRPPVRPWVPAPLLTLDGRSYPTAWARLWYPVPPGVMELNLEVPPPPRALVGPDSVVEPVDPLISELVTIRRGEVTELRCRAVVTAMPAADGSLERWDAFPTNAAV